MPDTAIENKINDLLEAAKSEKQKGNKENTIRFLQQAWDELPGPKENFSTSFTIAKYFIQAYLGFGMPTDALSWAEKIQTCGTNRPDFGEKEFLHGRVQLDLKNTAKAKELFSIAYKKSEGRSFTNDDSKYLKILKNK
jgi:hypothetical protein